MEIAQVTNLEFGNLLAQRLNGWVQEKIVNGKKLYVVVRR